MKRFDQVTENLKKMYKGSEEKKDELVSALKQWLKSNRDSSDKQKVQAIQCFLSDLNVF